tara:strand:- start:1012 stop:1302 length:291 start_codon:yes stop_codon:yes gene_type:complete
MTKEELLHRLQQSDDKALIDGITQLINNLEKENDELKGIKPGFFPKKLSTTGLPRFGIRWNGDKQPIATPFDDGYWTPFHIADEIISYYQNKINNG